MEPVIEAYTRGVRQFFRIPRDIGCFATAVMALLFLFHCNKPTEPPNYLPISLTGDSLVNIYDTLKVLVSVSEADSGALRYIWFIDNPFHVDTSLDSIIVATFSAADSGRHCLVVKAVDNIGTESPLDTFHFTVTFSRPCVTLLAAPAASVGIGYRIQFKGSDADNRISHYRWYIDDSLKSMTTPDTAVIWTWKTADTGKHTIVAQAIDRDGIRSRPDSITVNVLLNYPILRPLPDTAVKVNDTLVVRFSAVSPDSLPLRFRYFIDDPKALIVTGDGVVRLRWGVADSGRHTLVVEAIGENAIPSAPDTSIITVTYRRPTVKLRLPDTVAYLNDTVKLVAQAADADGSIDHYRWSIGGAKWFIGPTDTLPWFFGGKSEGVSTIRAAAVDNDGFFSDVDSAFIRVLLGAPSVTAPRDTAVSSLDSVRITCQASDPNGTIVTYLWNVSGATWDDSTTTPDYIIRYKGKAVVRLIAGVRDDDGLVATDTVTVTFNRPLDSIVILSPGPRDTLTFFQTVPACSVSFAYGAADPDGDSVTYSLAWGPVADSLSTIYEGKNTAAGTSVTRPGHYFWRLTARDAWGHFRTAGGTVTILKVYRICFVGHSIVAGMGGDSIVGGFRGGVLDSLRSKLGNYERLKAVGPYLTSFMHSSTIDDSCLAMPTTTAREIFLIFLSHQRLVADIWVLMLGVNNGYGLAEQRYILYLVDHMIVRNPAARLYVLNGMPYPSQSVYDSLTLQGFNKFLADSALDRNKKGAHVFIADAFSTMSKNGTYDSTWFSDNLHPNQRGYNRLRDLIFSTMLSSDPPAIPKLGRYRGPFR